MNPDTTRLLMEFDRLLREARALARLTHPNVVAVYDVGTADGEVFFASELVKGRTLRAWLRDEEPELGELLAFD